MARVEKQVDEEELRGQTGEANSLKAVVLETVKLWKRHHLSYDQSKQVVEQVRRELELSALEHGGALLSGWISLKSSV